MTDHEIRDSELGTDHQLNHTKIPNQVQMGVPNTYVERRAHIPYNIIVLLVHIHTYNNNIVKINKLFKLLRTFVNL